MRVVVVIIVVMIMVVAMLVAMMVIVVMILAFEESGLDIENAVEIEGVAIQNLVQRDV
jgi:hypothetical protein